MNSSEDKRIASEARKTAGEYAGSRTDAIFAGMKRYLSTEARRTQRATRKKGPAAPGKPDPGASD